MNDFLGSDLIFLFKHERNTCFLLSYRTNSKLWFSNSCNWPDCYWKQYWTKHFRNKLAYYRWMSDFLGSHLIFLFKHEKNICFLLFYCTNSKLWFYNSYNCPDCYWKQCCLKHFRNKLTDCRKLNDFLGSHMIFLFKDERNTRFLLFYCTNNKLWFSNSYN